MDYFDILLAKKLSGGGGGGEITVEGLNVEDNGTYTAPSGKAYSPVVVNLPLGEKAITANGEYNASADDLKGYSKVTINVAGYKVKDMPTGAISSFDDGTDNPLKELKVSIVPVQAGSGDPSPSNPRPISGWSSVNIHVADGETPHIVDNETDIALGQTVYGGELDVTGGVLRVTKGIVDLSTITTWNSGAVNAQTGMIRFLNVINGKEFGKADMLCNLFPTKATTGYDTDTSESISGIASSNALYLVINSNRLSGDLSTRESRAEALLNWLENNPTYVVYNLDEPTTIQLTPTQVKSLLKDNNIWADSGQIISGQYFAEL